MSGAAAGPVRVTHALGGYPVYVETGALARLGALAAEHLDDRRIAMIADAAVYRLYREGRLGAAGWDGETITFPPGESSKTREEWSPCVCRVFRLSNSRTARPG